MLKALLKKQFAELFYNMIAKKNSKSSKKGRSALYALLFVFLFGWIGVSFFTIAVSFGEQIVAKELDWLYLTMVTAISILFGVVGSVFSAYTALYNAKDNETLLSMPMQPWKILFARMASVYVIGFVYAAVVFIPASVAYFTLKVPTVSSVIALLAMLFLNGIVVLALTCILGFFVALIAGKLKRKSILTAIVTLILIGVYYAFFFRLQSSILKFAENAEQIAEKIKSSFYPLYVLGRAGEGKLTFLLIYVAVCVVITALMAFVLSRTFIKIVTTNKGDKKAKYTEKPQKVRSLQGALLWRELKKFTSSALYMLNCGLGIVIMPAIAVALIIYAPTISEHIPEISPTASTTIVPIGIAAMMMFFMSISMVTAPSISLEGKNLWLIRSLPVPTEKILMTKRNMQLILISGPALFLAISACVALRLGIFNLIAVPALAILSLTLTANLGLILNVKHPNFTWTNENVPIKQSLPIFVMTMLGMFAPMFIAGIYLPFGLIFNIPAWIYIALIDVIFAVFVVVTNRWIKKKGVILFERL